MGCFGDFFFFFFFLGGGGVLRMSTNIRYAPIEDESKWQVLQQSVDGQWADTRERCGWKIHPISPPPLIFEKIFVQLIAKMINFAWFAVQEQFVQFHQHIKYLQNNLIPQKIPTLFSFWHTPTHPPEKIINFALFFTKKNFRFFR